MTESQYGQLEHRMYITIGSSLNFMLLAAYGVACRI